MAKTNTKPKSKPTHPAIMQLTQNVGEHRYGQTFTREQAEAAGIEPSNLRELVTDRQITKSDTTTRG